MPPFEPDAEALRYSPVRIVPAIGEAGQGSLARRGGEALATLRRVTPVVFPGDHGRLRRQPVVTKQRPRRVYRKVARGVGLNGGLAFPGQSLACSRLRRAQGQARACF